jgi:hypothetical protein
MPGVTGNKTSFKLDNAAGVLTDISTYLTNVEGSADVEKLDGTTFQPTVSVPLKENYYGFSEKTLSLSVNWSPGAETFFSGIELATDLDYEYGPEGTASGKVKIYGKCNAGTWSGPSSSIGAITTASFEVTKTTELRGTY